LSPLRQAAFALAAMLPFLPGFGQAQNRTQPRDITIEAFAFEHFSAFERERRQFGRLTFLGGLELRARDSEFGGFSAAQTEPDGRGFIAITDHGSWLRARFVEEAGTGKLTGIDQARIGPLLAPNGRRLKETRYFDAEGAARKGSQLFVSVERSHDILQFDLAADGTPGRGRLIEVPAEVKTLALNGGMEGLGVMPRQSAHAGALVALAEKAPPGAASTDIPGFILGASGGRFLVRRIGSFDVTDVNFLPAGDMVILERRFIPLLGLGMRLRRIPIAEVKPGAVLTGEILIEADLSHQIDNMEALMIHRDAKGRAILTLMSDNNFSILQRNLVLRFALDE